MRFSKRKTRGALIALFCFFALSSLLFQPFTAFQDFWWEQTKGLGKMPVPKIMFTWLYMVGRGIGLLVPFVVAMLIYYWVACKPRPDGYTRCGKCNYILQGLTEPQCPECGKEI